MNLLTYLLCVSFNNFKKGENIIQQFINSNNKNQATLLLIENGSLENYNKYNEQFITEKSVELFYSKSPNKSKCLNYLINDVIKEDEALIICTDNDVKYPADFVKTYKETAFKAGKKYYFGGSMIVPKLYNKLVNQNYKNLYQLSQFSKADKDFKKSKRPIFLGANFAFFKSQWKRVYGFDERFSPGSKYGIAAQESTFQKKLLFVNYTPLFVSNNHVIHYPEEKSYQLDAVKKRTKQNGLTHGFSKLANSKSKLKLDYLFRVGGLLKSLIKSKSIKNNSIYMYKKYYLIGHLKALRIYFFCDNRCSIYNNLEKIED